MKPVDSMMKQLYIEIIDVNVYGNDNGSHRKGESCDEHN